MATLRDLQYMIEANTEGLNKAFPVLDKLVGTLERLDKTVKSFNSHVSKEVDGAGKSFERAGRSVTKSAAQIEAALKRQQAAAISAQQKLISLNNDIKSAGGDAKLISANVQAYQQLEKVLKNVDTTAAEASLAKAKFNATLTESKRRMLEFQSAQKQVEVSQRTADSALLKQSNTVERVRIQYENLVHVLQGKGVSPQNIEQVTRAFDQFETEMQSGVLTAQQYSESMNRMNAVMAKVKRNNGFAAGLGAGVRELATSAQVALGPLSGIAARLTALKSLSTATSVGIATVVGVVIALGAALVKAVIDGTKFEKQMARINAVLETTGNAAIISSKSVELVVRRVSQSTNALQGDIRDAAAGLVMIDGITDDLLESALKASQGLALASGGSITSSYRTLARVLKDPIENLNTLTEYGKSFTASEKERIKMLAESGRRQEAVVYILESLTAQIAAAEGETNSLSGAWHRMTDSFTSFNQNVATGAGLLSGLEALLNKTANDLDDAGTGFVVIGNAIRRALGYETTNTVTTLKQGVVDLYGALRDTSAPVEEVRKVEDGLREVIARIKEVEGTQLMPDVDLSDLNAAIDAVNAGNINAASRALEKYVVIVESAAKAEREHEIALTEAENMYTRLKGEYLDIISTQDTLENKLKGLNDQWDLMVESLMKTGKTAEQANAILRRLRQEIETSGGSVNAYVENLKRSTIAMQMDAKISAASGAEKRRLQTEQRILNDLWSSGVITAADYEQALIDLREGGLGPLADAVRKASKAFEEAEFAKKTNDMAKATERAMETARRQAQVATSSIYAQADALAVLAKEQELADAGHERGSEFWKQQVEAARELNRMEFSAKWAADFKSLQDSAKLAQIATSAATKSAIEEAQAVALAAEMVQMENEGIAEGSALWQQRLGIVQQMVNLDFTRSHIDEVKALQAQAVEQQNILDAMFYSEGTRKRMIAHAQKEYELAQKYGSLMDERAQKELKLFEMLQARQKVIDEWQEVANVIDNAFKTLEDSLVDFVKTGEFNFHKFANAVLEDIFRMTLRMAILDPMKDWIGGMMKGVTKGGGIGEAFTGAMPSIKDVLGTTPATPMSVSVVNDLGSIIPGLGGAGGVGEGGSLGGAATSAANSIFGGAQTQDLLRGSLSPLTSAAEEASASLVDMGNGISMTADAFSHKMDLIATEAAKVGQVATNGLAGIDRVAAAHGTLSNTASELSTSMSSLDGATNKAVNAITNNFGNAQGGLANLQYVNQGATRAMKLTESLEQKIKEAVGAVYGPGATAKIYSGGQTAMRNPLMKNKPGGWTGTHAHDGGMAGDAYIYDAAGNQMKGQDLNPLIQYWQAKKLGGTGFEMKGGGIHLDERGVRAWDYGTKGATASQWQAVQAGRAGVMPQGMQSPGAQLPQTMQPPAFNPMGQQGAISPFGSGGGTPTDIGTISSGGVEQLSQAATKAGDSLTSMSETVSTSLTAGLDQAANSATKLADSGLDSATDAAQTMATQGLQQATQSTIQSATQTAQMGVQSTVTSAQVQQLGTAAMTAAAQMQGGGIMGAVLHGGSGSGGVFMGSSRGWAGAPRLHGGLHSNEFRAILKRGEGVFTEDQMDMLGNAIKKNGETENGGNGGGGGRRGFSGGITVNLNGVKDFDSFRKSQSQLNAGVMSAAQQAMTRQG